MTAVTMHHFSGLSAPFVRSKGTVSGGVFTREGIETARLNGKQIGRQKNSVVVTRKSIESKEVIRKLSKEFGGNLSDAEIMRLTGLARNTYYKYKRELRGK